MSALLVGGASTFVSCKDYDGDQAAVTNAELSQLESTVGTNYQTLSGLISGLQGDLSGKQDKLSQDIMDDLAKLNETISKANTAEQWVTANSDLYKLSAKVEALLSLSSLAGKEEALAKLADMKDTWGDDFKNVVVRSELAAYLTKDELLQAWPSIQAMFEKKEDMHKDVEAIIDSITAANAENFTTYAGLVAAFDKVPAKLQKIDDQLVKLLAWNENIQYTLDNTVQSVYVDMIVNPVFGTFNTPFGVESNVIVGFVGGEIEKKNFNGVNVGGLATSLDGGKVYFHVNPNDINATGLKFSLVGGDGKEAPGYALGGLTKCEYNITSVPTRAPINGYVADAGIVDGRAAIVNVPKDELKDVAKNVLGKLRGQEALDVTNAVRTIYNTVANFIPQCYLLQAEYKVKNQEGEEIAKVYTGSEKIAAVTVKPLAYTTNIGVVGEKVNIPSIPAFEDLLGIEIKDVNIDPVTANIDDFTFTVVDGNYLWGNKVVVEKEADGTGTIDMPLYSTNQRYVVPFTSCEEEPLFDDYNNQVAIKYTVHIAQDANKIITDLNTQLTSVEDQVNTTLGSVKDALNKAGKYYNKVAPKLNKVISKVNYILDNANQLLQPIMLGVADGDAFRLSEVEAAPTVVKANGENAIVLAPTSYTLELLAPAYKKSIKVNGTQLNDANLDGATKTVVANLKSGLNEIEYSTMDFYGNVVTKKYYVKVR